MSAGRGTCFGISVTTASVVSIIPAMLPAFCSADRTTLAEQEVGDLKASMLLDFCLRELGPSIYNQAIADAQARVHERTSELDAICYEPEFNYWKR